MQQGPQHRVDAVGTDQHVTALLHVGTVGHREACRDALAILGEALQTMALAQIAGRQPRLRRPPQDAMQFAAVDRKLGRIVPSPETALAHPYRLPEMIQVTQFVRANGGIVEFLQHAERFESAGAVRQDVNADAEFLYVRGRFEHGARNAQLVQRQCQGQTADSASRNQNAPAAGSGWAPLFRADCQ